jgi:hypothetical protein
MKTYVIDGNTSHTPKEGAHGSTNGLMMIIIIIIIIVSGAAHWVSSMLVLVPFKYAAIDACNCSAACSAGVTKSHGSETCTLKTLPD